MHTAIPAAAPVVYTLPVGSVTLTRTGMVSNVSNNLPYVGAGGGSHGGNGVGNYGGGDCFGGGNGLIAELTYRDKMAIQILRGLIESHRNLEAEEAIDALGSEPLKSRLSREAYEYADAMIARSTQPWPIGSNGIQ